MVLKLKMLHHLLLVPKAWSWSMSILGGVAQPLSHWTAVIGRTLALQGKKFLSCSILFWYRTQDGAVFLLPCPEIGAAENLPLHCSSSHHIPSTGVLAAVACCLGEPMGDLAAYPFHLQEKFVLAWRTAHPLWERTKNLIKYVFLSSISPCNK